MNRIVLQLLAVGFCFAFVQSLQCYKCYVGIGDLCITTKTTCESNEHCFSGEGETVSVSIKMKGCLEVSKCNKTKEESFPSISNTTLYSMTKTCCNTDFCNAAPGLPAASRLSLVAAAASALFAANMLI